MPNITDTTWQDKIDISDGSIFPLHRQQASRVTGGTALVRTLAPTIWKAEFETVTMLLDDALDLEADLIGLRGSLHTVVLYDPRRPKPKLHSGGSLGGYGYTSFGESRYIINLELGSTPLSKGDWFSFQYGESFYLHRIVNMVTAVQAEVFPAISHLAPTAFSIVVDKAHAKFQIDPISVNNKIVRIDRNKQATISFQGVQTIR